MLWNKNFAMDFHKIIHISTGIIFPNDMWIMWITRWITGRNASFVWKSFLISSTSLFQKKSFADNPCCIYISGDRACIEYYGCRIIFAECRNNILFSEVYTLMLTTPMKRYANEMMDVLSKLISIESTKGEAVLNMPYGKGPSGRRTGPGADRPACPPWRSGHSCGSAPRCRYPCSRWYRHRP